ncbi:MAG: bifunctional 23S rRNA (guanine(2069)-N(7))-methyltransferase RlmK/23S rRNA (guanine(2445)-N(2))-methyltransferase RlmL [Thermodesulfobacteriota bacterium]
MTNQKQYRLTANCGAGLESLVEGELKSFGVSQIERGKGLVRWQGTLESGYRACLWSRFASRIFLEIGEFTVSNEDELYEHCLGIDWGRHLDLETSFAIDCSLNRSPITHSQYAALRVKDALVDSFRKRLGERPSVELERPGLRIKLHIQEKRATLSIDLSGEPLHRRGYREASGIAPLKENLAAAIVTLAGWNASVDKKEVLLDPLCGSATLLIEGALIYGDSAPGLGRSYFGFSGWLGHNEKLWQRLIDEAMEREDKGLAKDWPTILGYDSDPLAVAAARKNISRAGLDEKIIVKQSQLASVNAPADHGFFICNPPYGDRLAEEEEALQTHRAIGRILTERFGGWRAAVFTGHPDFSDRMGPGWQQRFKLYNGPIACRLLCTEVEPNQIAANFKWQLSTEAIEGPGSEFGNRLRKNLKKLLKWAAKEDISCLRVYDRDLPEFNISVDLYDKWVHVRENRPPATVDEKKAAERFQLALAMIRKVLGVNRERVYIKTRSRHQKGKTKHRKQGVRQKMMVVREDNCHLLVNFTDYPDSGLFLDHRPIRKKIHALARGKRFLNLFSHTGAATVHAAVGGAASTTSVDLSKRYSSWCRMNLALNGFSGPSHKVVQGDCLKWLAEERGLYDLIFVDPPTFSNTRGEKNNFDIQRDHVRLLHQIMARVAPGGELFFSTGFRRFKLAKEFTEKFGFVEISRQTIPRDFERNSRVHHCYHWRKDGNATS